MSLVGWGEKGEGHCAGVTGDLMGNKGLGSQRGPFQIMEALSPLRSARGVLCVCCWGDRNRGEA